MTTINISCSRDYTISIGRGALEKLPEAVALLQPSGVHIVADSNTAIYIPRVISQLATAGISSDSTIIPAGEEHKTPSSAARICSRFASSGFDRNGVVLALGGGVVGDTVGFAASVYMRGVRHIALPTTIIAMLDSSVGGKTAVDLPEGKNLMGSFWQPSAVISELSFLDSLPAREFSAGLGEAVKYYALGAVSLRALTPPRDNIEEFISECCRLKARFVELDERDNGARSALNLGHTFAHAIEKYYRYKEYNHGEAVAIGLRLALQAGVLLGITPKAVADDVIGFAEDLGLDLSVSLSLTELAFHMDADKKNYAGKRRLVLIEDIGSPMLYEIDKPSLSNLLSLMQTK